MGFRCIDKIMRYYKYIDPSGEYLVSEQEILETYAPWWIERMKRKFGSEVQWTNQNIIDDWCIVHWAWKISD
jgi:hypothetical protein